MARILRSPGFVACVVASAAACVAGSKQQPKVESVQAANTVQTPGCDGFSAFDLPNTLNVPWYGDVHLCNGYSAYDAAWRRAQMHGGNGKFVPVAPILDLAWATFDGAELYVGATGYQDDGTGRYVVPHQPGSYAVPGGPTVTVFTAHTVTTLERRPNCETTPGVEFYVETRRQSAQSDVQFTVDPDCKLLEWVDALAAAYNGLGSRGVYTWGGTGGGDLVSYTVGTQDQLAATTDTFSVTQFQGPHVYGAGPGTCIQSSGPCEYKDPDHTCNIVVCTGEHEEHPGIQFVNETTWSAATSGGVLYSRTTNTVRRAVDGIIESIAGPDSTTKFFYNPTSVRIKTTGASGDVFVGLRNGALISSQTAVANAAHAVQTVFHNDGAIARQVTSGYGTLTTTEAVLDSFGNPSLVTYSDTLSGISNQSLYQYGFQNDDHRALGVSNSHTDVLADTQTQVGFTTEGPGLPIANFSQTTSSGVTLPAWSASVSTDSSGRVRTHSTSVNGVPRETYGHDGNGLVNSVTAANGAVATIGYTGGVPNSLTYAQPGVPSVSQSAVLDSSRRPSSVSANSAHGETQCTRSGFFGNWTCTSASQAGTQVASSSSTAATLSNPTSNASASEAAFGHSANADSTMTINSQGTITNVGGNHNLTFLGQNVNSQSGGETATPPPLPADGTCLPIPCAAMVAAGLSCTSNDGC